MDDDKRDKSRTESIGMLFGVGAYGLWGLFPLYWKRLSSVPSLQILMHRIAWAFALTFALALLLGKRRLIAELLRDRRRLGATIAAGFLVSLNWGIYIWAVNAGHIVETSIGYFLNPLVSVALGSLVLKEKIDRGIKAACAIAAVGIAVLTVSYGKLPWIALSLAATFSLYGLIKKLTNLDGLTGLAMETAPVMPFAIGYLVFEELAGRGAFGRVGGVETAMLVLAGAVTALPLFFFAEGVKRVPLSRMGFLQYISPTLQLALGLFVFGETLTAPKAAAFAFIVAALVVFAATRPKRARDGGAA
ncbi:MAG: EamA family transporter RarD [Spirochaetaceae bacterium]|nr:EamA family transporter RarD [Spirochaetaceae bacterium]